MVETQQAFQCSKVVQKDPIASQMVNLPVFDHAESFWANFVGHFGQKMILPTKNKVFLTENLFCSKMVWNDPKWSKTVRLIACHIRQFFELYQSLLKGRPLSTRTACTRTRTRGWGTDSIPNALLVASFKSWISWWFNILEMTALFPFYEVKLPVLMFMWQNRVHLGKVVKRWSGTILHCATISPSPNSWYLTIPSVDTFLGRPSEDVICFAADAGVHFAWSAEREERRGKQC